MECSWDTLKTFNKSINQGYNATKAQESALNELSKKFSIEFKEVADNDV